MRESIRPLRNPEGYHRVLPALIEVGCAVGRYVMDKILPPQAVENIEYVGVDKPEYYQPNLFEE